VVFRCTGALKYPHPIPISPAIKPVRKRPWTSTGGGALWAKPSFDGPFRDLNMTPRVSRKTYLDWAIHRPKVLGACIPCLGVGKLLKRVKMAPENSENPPKE
jgi:hypothetical protein